MTDIMRISEVFGPTISGEGSCIGSTTHFVRLAGCSLQCSFCDSAFTWAWDRYDRAKESHPMTVAEVTTAVERLDAFDEVRHVTISGGEPTLQAVLLQKLLDRLGRERPVRFDLETAGVRSIPHRLLTSFHNVTVSPKLEGSGNDLARRYRPLILKTYAAYLGTTFKFVITSPADVLEAVAIVTEVGIPPERVYLMPEARTRDELTTRSPVVAEAAKKYGFRFSTRLHIQLWGDKRGV